MADTTTPTGGDPSPKPGHFMGLHLPDTTILHDRNIQTLILARNLQKLGIATISYGGMVYLADQGASQIQVSIVGVTGYVAALLFGTQGGAIVDSVSKRTALVAGYTAQGALCFLVPWLFGTDVVDLVFLAFTVAMLSCITSPALKSSVALVSTPAAMATVAAMLNLFGSFGTAIGQGFLAPILIKVSGINAVMYVSGIVLSLGAVWALRVPSETEAGSMRLALQSVPWKPAALDRDAITRWILDTPAISSMILVGAVVFALGETVGTLIPVYVREVLDADPANSVFIFAPSAIGYLAGAVSAPKLIRRFGERKVGFASFLVASVGIIALGFVNQLAPILAPISPTRLFELFGIDLSDAMLAAGFIAIPANYGSTATGAAVQNYVNRRVSLVRQGGVFGMEKVVENALTIVTVLLLGTIATLFGSQIVFIVAPIVALGIVVWLVRYSFRHAHQEAPSRKEVVEEFWSRPDDAADTTPPEE